MNLIVKQRSWRGILLLGAALSFSVVALFSCSNPLGSNTSAPVTFLANLLTGLTDANSTYFNAGNFSGSALWDATNSYVRLGSATSSQELNSNWTPAWSNLVGYWTLDEVSGSSSIADSSVSQASGTPAGGTILGQGGKLSKAVYFNGSTGSITASDNALPSGNSPRTISAWIYPYSVSGTYAIAGYGSANTDQGFGLSIVSGYLTSFGWSDDNVSTTNAIPTFVWTHVVATYDGTTSKVYVNGSLIRSAAKSWNTVKNGIFSIGVNLNSSNYYSGDIDDVAVWNTALSASAIGSIFQHEASNHTGTFTSRVILNPNSNGAWNSLSWLTTLPFFKELTDSATSETSTAYPLQSSTLMNGIVGLWHFDEPAGTSGASSVIDHSGQLNHGTPGNATFGNAGVVGTSAYFTGGWVSIGSGLNPWSGDFTISAWLRPTASGVLIIGGNESYGTNGFRFGIGYGSTWNLWSYESGGSLNISSAVGAARNQWTHVTVTYTRATSTGKIYVNGVLSSTSTGTLLPPAGGLALGGGVGGQPNWTGNMDEYAIWNRALQPNEALELYRRGANRAKFQVRSCTDAVCSTNPSWLGPDGTNQTYFSEMNNNSVPTANGDPGLADSVQTTSPAMTFSSFPSVTVPSSNFFQYRAVMESDDTGTGCNYGASATWCSPELSSVTVGTP
jgi:hypothetical protein